MSSNDEVVQYEERRPLLGGSVESSVHVDEEAIEKRKCVKNLVLHCVSIVFVFTSSMSLQTMERDFTREFSNALVTSALYVGLLAACLFSPIIIKKTGYKWTMIGCFIAHAIFTIANFYPGVYTLIPASGLLGLITGPFWTAQSLFLTNLATRYGLAADIDPNVVFSRFNGMFYSFYQSSRIWGNLLSSEIFAKPDDVFWNVTYQINETCGAEFCTLPTDDPLPEIPEPSDKWMYSLVGLYLGLCCAGVLIKALFVDNIKPLENEDSGLTFCETLTASLRIHCNGCLGLLIPLMFYTGLEQVFLFREFVQAFVTCELGYGYIGYVMITFAGVNTVASFMMGQLEKCSGRILMFLTATIVQLAMLTVMLKWVPGRGEEDNWLLYFLPGWWGLADSIWQTTLLSLIAVEFAHARDAAFATYRFWQGAGMAAAFAYSFVVCMTTKIYITMFILSGSIVLYFIMELYMRRMMNRPYIDLYAPIIE